MAKGKKENFHQDNFHEKRAIDNSKNVKSTEHFGFAPVRGSVLIPHQLHVYKNPFYSVLFLNFTGGRTTHKI
jgi:hypothetical protein